jgi:excisionase family DNA binding protein
MPFLIPLEAPMESLTGQALDRRSGAHGSRSVSLDQAAVLLGVSRRTIYNRIRKGRLRTIRTLGGSQRVLLDSVTPAGTGARGTPSRTDGLAVDRHTVGS